MCVTVLKCRKQYSSVFCTIVVTQNFLISGRVFDTSDVIYLNSFHRLLQFVVLSAVVISSMYAISFN